MKNQVDTFTRPIIIGAGLVCLDIIKDRGDDKFYTGGSCANVVSALAFLGWQSKVIIGNYSDLAGEIISSNLDRIGVHRINLQKSSGATPRIIECLNRNDNSNTHSFLFSCPECGTRLPSLKPISIPQAKPIFSEVDQANVFYTDRSSEGINFLRKSFREKKCWTVYEPNSARNLKALLENVSESNIIKFSSDKVPDYASEEIRRIATNGITVLLVRTKGKNGLEFSYRNKNNTMSKWIHLSAQPVPKLVDSSGAGDWCTAGLLFNLISKFPKSRPYLSKTDVIAALEFGQALSAISCGFVGAQGMLYGNTDEIIGNILKKEWRLTHTKNQPAVPRIIADNKYCSTCLLPTDIIH